MIKGNEKYRKLMAELDKKDILISIQKTGENEYTFINNGTIEKVYKKRESCNKRILKLYKKHLKIK